MPFYLVAKENGLSYNKENQWEVYGILMSTLTTSQTSQQTAYSFPRESFHIINERKRRYTRHDQLFKHLIETFFAQFIEGFFADIYENIDFSSLIFLSEEIVATVHDKDERRLDIVAEVFDKSSNSSVIVHVESQSYYQSDFNKRMYHYSSQLHRKFDKPVIPIAVFSYDESWNKDEYTVNAVRQQLIYMNYFTVHLRSLPWRDYINVENPVVAAFLSQMNYREDEKVEVTVEFFRSLAMLDLTKEQRDILIDFFQSYVILNEKEEEILMKSVKKHPDADKILEITNPFVEYGKRQGREEGREEGIEQRNIEIALEMLDEGLPTDLIAKVTKLSEEKIKELQTKS